MARAVWRAGYGRAIAVPTPIACRVHVDELWGLRVQARVASAGAWTVAFTSELCDSGLGLHSAYTGDSRAEHTTVVELHRANGASTTEVRHVPAGACPVVAGRRRCLHDHLMRLQDVLVEHFGCAVAIDFDERAELAAES